MRYHLICWISLFMLSATGFAQEENDTPEGAERTSANGKVTEELYAPEDIDFFRFDIRENRDDPEHDTSGNLTVHFSQDESLGVDKQVGWQIDLYAEEDLANSLHTAFLPETRLELTFEQALSPGRYYYKVSSLNAEKAPNKTYTLDSNWKESEFYEKPPNSIPNTATPLKVNNLYAGNLATNTDIDFYQFVLTTNDTVTITFKQDTPLADSQVGWEVSLLASHNLSQPLQTASVPATKKSVGLQADLGIGTYYVRIWPLTDTQKAPKGRRYQLEVIAPNQTEVIGHLCPTLFAYAQHPVSNRWIAFPSHCEVPQGWFKTQTLLPTIESCPSPYATYRAKDGLLRIPKVEALSATGDLMGTWAVNLQQIPGDGFLFEVLIDTLRQIP